MEPNPARATAATRPTETTAAPKTTAPTRRQIVITIDGPAGAGKSVLSDRLARHLGYLYYDTGALYRAVTWLALRDGVEPTDEATLAELAATKPIDICPATVADGRQYDVYADGVDVTWAIRSPEVDARVSPVSAHPAVRAALLPVQRAAAARGGIVLAGRDAGTVVAPEAELKVYLDCSFDVRAERRAQQLADAGTPVDLARVRTDLERRDGLDSSRAAAPLKPAPGAIVVNADKMTVDEEVEYLARLARDREQACGRASDPAN
ncbi:MAG: (d)CMP kinase [Chloroflexi bacterium]|nr:(d)CMP kinase [Chloroflexota bacterium]